MTCDRCGREEGEFFFHMKAEWFLMHGGRTVFAWGISPVSAERCFCPECFESVAKAMARKDG